MNFVNKTIHMDYDAKWSIYCELQTTWTKFVHCFCCFFFYLVLLWSCELDEHIFSRRCWLRWCPSSIFLCHNNHIIILVSHLQYAPSISSTWTIEAHHMQLCIVVTFIYCLDWNIQIYKNCSHRPQITSKHLFLKPEQ